jgi:hypothetical protein
LWLLVVVGLWEAADGGRASRVFFTGVVEAAAEEVAGRAGEISFLETAEAGREEAGELVEEEEEEEAVEDLGAELALLREGLLLAAGEETVEEGGLREDAGFFLLLREVSGFFLLLLLLLLGVSVLEESGLRGEEMRDADAEALLTRAVCEPEAGEEAEGILVEAAASGFFFWLVEGRAVLDPAVAADAGRGDGMGLTALAEVEAAPAATVAPSLEGCGIDKEARATRLMRAGWREGAGGL